MNFDAIAIGEFIIGAIVILIGIRQEHRSWQLQQELEHLKSWLDFRRQRVDQIREVAREVHRLAAELRFITVHGLSMDQSDTILNRVDYDIASSQLGGLVSSTQNVELIEEADKFVTLLHAEWSKGSVDLDDYSIGLQKFYEALANYEESVVTNT